MLAAASPRGGRFRQSTRRPGGRRKDRTIPLANLYLIGAPKAATTSLADWLGQHPDVWWSVPKEPFHWSSDFPGQRAFYGFADRAAYAALYDAPRAAAARWRGDGSTTYLYSHTAVPAILAEVPDARFVVCLRDPVDLVPSYHRTQLLACNEDEPDVVRAWARSRALRLPRRVVPRDPELVDYPVIGRLGEALERVMGWVPPEQLHVVVLDDLRADPLGTYRDLLRFLEVDDTFEPDLRLRNPGDVEVRSRTLQRLANHPPPILAPVITRLRQWSRTTRLPGVAHLKRLLWRTPKPAEVGEMATRGGRNGDPRWEKWRPEVGEVATAGPDALRAELAAYFAPDVALLERLLGRTFDTWASHTLTRR